MRKIIKLILLILWMSLIFMFSSQNGSDSTETSSLVSKVLYVLIEFVFKGKYSLSEFVLKYMPIIRKLAHFSEYFILGVLAYLNVIEYSNKKEYLYAILFSVLYAISDEVHQLFVESRNGSIKDVLIDSLGVIIGVLICHMIFKRWKKVS